ncbi:MAG TPA: anhydro-N-acetylmuramic acid kinase [Micromonosporaceae bacterium]|nr:anhydro-N-acetylmuramic acid kinase [Micromonosporaceae bacterium]
MRAIGMISGTSYDAIDVAAAEFANVGGETLWLEPLGALEIPYPEELREQIADILPPHQTDIGQVCRLNAALGHAFADAASRALTELADGRADLVVSHGQTVFHWIEDGLALGTLQLGEPAWIAEQTGLPVLSDLRSADIARGGQGAPLVPVFDALLLEPLAAPRAALNLGGIANLTVIRPDGSLLGYDVGPGNALIDAAVVALADMTCDTDGRLARSGRIRTDLLYALLDEPYYGASPPKSTGKELFHWDYLRERLEQLPDEPPVADVVATVTELTAWIVGVAAIRHGITELVCSGGGTRNPALMERLAALGGGRWRVCTVDEYGVPAAAKEAYAFTLLGYLSWHGLPGSLPTATGALGPAILGSFTSGAQPLRLPKSAATPPRRLRIQPG